MGQKLAVLAALTLVLGLPFIVRLSVGQERAAAIGAHKDAKRLIITTPHVEQIRDEFGPAFDRWHARTYGQNVVIDWRTPGGTSDIIKQLEATAEAAARKGDIDPAGVFAPGVAGSDLFFGGGSFEHGKMKEEKSVVTADGKKVTYRLGRPAGFDQKQLDDWFGKNLIGVQNLYDPDQYWIGTALSGFGIVYNRDVLKKLGLPEPRGFADLTDPRYANMLALADGRQSGSITTTYDSILNKYGWTEGWRILRDMSANARYFASAATRVPVDVSQGEAAAGLSIDFYGRGQAQFLLKPGDDPDSGRIGYIDPEGAVYIDADPVSILNGASNPELAKRFVEFCLTTEAQALWQFPSRADGGARSKNNPVGADGQPMGPIKSELRRMPVRRMMYDPKGPYLAHMIDQTDPFKAASDVKTRGWRSAIPVLMAAFGIDTAHEARAAWLALNRARNAAKSGKISESVVHEMESLFYAFPKHTFRAGSLYANPETLADIPKPARDELRRQKVFTFEDLSRRVTKEKESGKLKPEILAEWERVLARRRAQEPLSQDASALLSEQTYAAIAADTDSWRDPDHGKRSLIAYTAFFSDNYHKIIQLARQHGL